MDSSTLDAAQADFEELLPHIQRLLNYRFRYLHSEALQEAVQEGTGLAWINFIRARQKGKSPGASPVAHYAALDVKCGRGVCGESSTDVSAAKAQKMGRSRVLNMGKVPAGNGASEERWDLSKALSDRRLWERPPERARVDLDYQAFLDGEDVDEQEARVFRLLSEGYRTCEIADQLGVSAPRVCQVKNSLGRKLKGFFGPGIAHLDGPGRLPTSYVVAPQA